MGSSSKTKSSKKKSSKLSSQARKMKKSRRTKSKKLSRRHDSSTDDSMSPPSISSPGNDSYSSNSDDDSMSSVSISTSSSEDAYRRRKNVSRSRGTLKKARKRARRRSPSRESRRDLPRMKKRKRSKKSSDSKSKKKSQRKKPRRDTSISSASSDTHSCSTCKDGSDRKSEGSGRDRSRFRGNKKDRRDSHKDKFRNKMSIRRSRSHSSYSRSKDQSNNVSHSEEKLLTENNSRRLRSVITFAEKPSEEEGNKWERELRKEEIVYDHDDYPSRSSSGGGSRKESSSPSPIAFDSEKWTENGKFVSNHGNDELSEGGNDAHEPYVCDPFMNEVETNNSVKESRKDIPVPDSVSGGDDLEAILRQKALQNLKKFRGGLKDIVKPTADKKERDDGDVSLSSTSKAEFVKDKLPEHASSTLVGRDVSDGGYTGKFSGIANENSSHPPHGLALSRKSKMEVHATRHPVMVTSVTRDASFRGRSSGTGSALNQTTASVASLDKNMIETENSETEIKLTQSVSPKINIDQDTACSSATARPASCSTSGQQSLNNQQDEAKDGSEYQQKTMSVMRGGEMVQVNYKVYIPKRAPALARRQLKR